MATVTGLQRTLRVLATTPNTAATAALEGATGSKQRAIRIGAALAMSARPDAESHTALLAAWPALRRDIRAALNDAEVTPRLRQAAIDAIGSEDVALCVQVSRYAVETQDYRLLPALVETAMNPQHKAAPTLASAAHRLSQSLSAELQAWDRGEACEAGDPSFARRPALDALGRAVDRYRDHGRRELIEAFLELTTYNNPVLRQVLRDASHAANAAVLESLHTCTGRGVMDVLVHAFEDPEAPGVLIEITAARSDRDFASRLLGHVGQRPGVRVMGNARRVDGFAFAESKHREGLLSLPADEQAAAMRLFCASGSAADERIELASLLMKRGGDAGRTAACEALRRLRSPRVPELLKAALRDPCPDVVAAAVIQLRRHSYENGLTELVGLLDHPAEVVVAAAQRSLGEFSLASFRAVYDSLAPEQRAKAGRLVGKADPEALKEIRGELTSPIIGKQLEALKVIGDLGLVDRLYDEVVAASKSTDAGVRTEAARVLAGCREKKVIAELTRLLDDKSSGVRAASQEAMRGRESLEVAEELVEGLQEEFPGGPENEGGPA